jgi:hypothetical protein
MSDLFVRSIVAVGCGFVAGCVLALIDAPSWVCAIGSGLTSGVATHFLLRPGRR